MGNGHCNPMVEGINKNHLQKKISKKSPKKSDGRNLDQLICGDSDSQCFVQCFIH